MTRRMVTVPAREQFHKARAVGIEVQAGAGCPGRTVAPGALEVLLGGDCLVALLT